ncbi:hypothetical protein [Nonomuraea sp. CA-141351]|uniref:hypothetical protein n=1 Tax=Nonomuraea sp. CA-141351 TaxID=3239996 RepID=UPI003D8E6E95
MTGEVAKVVLSVSRSGIVERRAAGPRISDMGTEAFYGTAAQIMPALLIALIVEIGFTLQKLREISKQAEIDNDASLVAAVGTRLNAWFGLSAVLVAAFVVGEVTAVLAVGFHWFNGWTFGLAGVSTLIMIVGVGVIPLARLAFISME